MRRINKNKPAADGEMTGANCWEEFWNRADTGLYVNQRNLEAHFACIEAGLGPHMPTDGAVLDYGCGDALAAAALARCCRKLTLYDASAAVQSRLRSRYAEDARIEVALDDGPQALPPGGFDVVTVVSVVQYVPPDALPALLRRWRGLLAPGGKLILADVVQPHIPLYRDVASQLTFARRNRFFIPAIFGIIKLALSDYRKIRKSAGFAAYTAPDMLRLLEEAGFDAQRLTPNIGPTPHRLSFIAETSIRP
jgi:cyclopropane fatty-acyl-phospholipid synthase-like methyltransferase